MKKMHGVAMTSAFLALLSLAPTWVKAAEDSKPDGAKTTDTGFKAQLDGAGFGGGVWVTQISGRVKQASIVNGTVRVTDEDDTLVAPMLESHYLFTPDVCLFGMGKNTVKDGKYTENNPQGLNPGNWGIGPMVVAQLSSDQLFDAVGLGLVFAMKRTDSKDDKVNGFNLGAGYVLDLDAQKLGAGFTDGAAAPAGAKEVSYLKSNEGGFFVSFSWKFK